MKNVIFAKKAPAAVGPYSHAIDCGNLVFLSGQIPLVPETGLIAEGGIQVQTRQMMANIQAVLASAGTLLRGHCRPAQRGPGGVRVHLRQIRRERIICLSI